MLKPLPIELFIPRPLGADAVNARYDENYNLMGRLKPDVPFEQAQPTST